MSTITRQDITVMWQEAFNTCQCEKRSADKVVAQLPESLKAKASAALSEVTFNRRRYGTGQFYCFPNHPLFNKDTLDPWPAVQYPKAVLLVELVRRLASSTE